MLFKNKFHWTFTTLVLENFTLFREVESSCRYQECSNLLIYIISYYLLNYLQILLRFSQIYLDKLDNGRSFDLQKRCLVFYYWLGGKVRQYLFINTLPYTVV